MNTHPLTKDLTETNFPEGVIRRMPNYRRAQVSGGTFFFTVVTYRRRGVWQRRFWEHTIKDENDFQTLFDDVHYNPVKHNLVNCPGDLEASSFHRWAKADLYPPDWACGKHPPPTFPITEEDYGEAF